MKQAINATLEVVAGIAMAAVIVMAGIGVSAIVNRETCPKSGGVCNCVRCMCDDGCPGVCAKKCCEK